MSLALPVVSGKEAIRALLNASFEQVSQKGSHVKLKHPDGRIAIVPMHNELAAGTLKSIIRQASMTVEEFMNYLG
ncbi:type II toxin-antitoxin system HicA family toxin [Ammoniphilus resinae]|uniref:RNA binding protein YcfA (HicA-like mRNA interferase family) n=1 Tax=Ammoniphilus resinae TaxID=861532 RepID=A0ABS4GYL3_9BACL|nr:type II toxin-antitoxin system HicA family toxin [Ammoniphilus resinae]MBP1934975.1 putative RNA binding protein YcfA (HicA-like mRNA interferase family) [Ammoniphilus resinae]